MPLSPPPRSTPPFNHIWKDWLNFLYNYLLDFIATHTGGGTPTPPATGTSWNAHGSTAVSDGTASNPLIIEDGSFLIDNGTAATGEYPTAGTHSGGGDEYKFLYVGDKASLRVGRVGGTNWDDAGIGNRTIFVGDDGLITGNNASGFGNNITVSGNNSFGAGNGTVVSGAVSFGFGKSNTISGAGSIGLGEAITAAGAACIGMGKTVTVGTAGGIHNNAISIGASSRAPLGAAIAIGESAQSDGTASLALGKATSATGTQSTCAGFTTSATNSNSVSIGTFLATSGSGSMTLGVGAGGGASRLINAVDDCIYIGVGTEPTLRLEDNKCAICNAVDGAFEPLSTLDVGGSVGYQQDNLASDNGASDTSEVYAGAPTLSVVDVITQSQTVIGSWTVTRTTGGNAFDTWAVVGENVYLTGTSLAGTYNILDATATVLTLAGNVGVASPTTFALQTTWRMTANNSTLLTDQLVVEIDTALYPKPATDPLGYVVYLPQISTVANRMYHIVNSSLSGEADIVIQSDNVNGNFIMDKFNGNQLYKTISPGSAAQIVGNNTKNRWTEI